MKYALTGHTEGIGLGLYQRLGKSTLGFSRRNGYDIKIKEDRKRIINEIKDCDVFINNATDEFGQVLMLIDLFKEWKDLNKTIINVGSRISEVKLPKDRLELLEYQAEKLILKQMVDQLQGYTCQVNYKWFAYVGTEKMLTKYPHFTSNDYITVEQSIDIILS